MRNPQVLKVKLQNNTEVHNLLRVSNFDADGISTLLEFEECLTYRDVVDYEKEIVFNIYACWETAHEFILRKQEDDILTYENIHDNRILQIKIDKNASLYHMVERRMKEHRTPFVNFSIIEEVDNPNFEFPPCKKGETKLIEIDKKNKTFYFISF